MSSIRQQPAFLDLGNVTDSQLSRARSVLGNPDQQPTPPPSTITDGPEPDLRAYDLIVIGLSGKDGHAALDVMVDRARCAGVFDRLYTVHADLGLIEWPSVVHHGRYYPDNRELVAATSLHYGIPPERHIETRRVVTDPTGVRRAQSLLEQIAMHGKFPDIARRFCTSDAKTTKISAALTPLVKHLRQGLRRAVRILNVTGIRADESARRAGLETYTGSVSNTWRHQDDYLPVHEMSTAAVYELVDASGADHHWAYDSEPGANDWAGMSRLSCSFCILGAKADLILAARRRPRLAALYHEVEVRIGHAFKVGMPMSRILEWAQEDDGPAPGIVLTEDGPEFTALEEAVRAQLAKRTKLRGGTEYTTVLPGCLDCLGC